MSIHDLLQKINPFGQTKGYFDQSFPISRQRLIISSVLIASSMILGLTAIGGSIYLMGKIEQPEPVQIQCSADVIKALEATSTPIKIPKATHAGSVKKANKPAKKLKKIRKAL